MKKQRSGCCLGTLFKWIVYGFALMVVLALFGSVNGDKDAAQPTATVKASTSTAAPTAAPTEESYDILLKWSELGEYGKYFTFNESVEKAEESDKETIIQYFVPAGTYTITNEGKGPWAYVNIYSKETIITEDGWEEPAETGGSPRLLPGDSCEMTIPEGWYIELQENYVFRLVQK